MPKRRPSTRPATAGSSPHSRRQFLQVLGATTALPLVAGLPAWAQAPAPTPTPAPPPVPPATTPATPPADPEVAGDKADAQKLFETLQRRYGSRWTSAQGDAVRDDIADTLGSGRALRKLPLHNSDEPAVVFVAREPRA